MVETVRFIVAVTLILGSLMPETLLAGDMYWLMEKSDPAGKTLEVLKTADKEPETWQLDWVNYAKIVAGPFATEDEAAAECLAGVEQKGNYYRGYRCE